VSTSRAGGENMQPLARRVGARAQRRPRPRVASSGRGRPSRAATARWKAARRRLREAAAEQDIVRAVRANLAEGDRAADRHQQRRWQVLPRHAGRVRGPRCTRKSPARGGAILVNVPSGEGASTLSHPARHINPARSPWSRPGGGRTPQHSRWMPGSPHAAIQRPSAELQARRQEGWALPEVRRMLERIAKDHLERAPRRLGTGTEDDKDNRGPNGTLGSCWRANCVRI
jgi:hypothetical protein